MHKLIIKKWGAIIVPMLFLSHASTASAITIDVGPVYTPPGAGTETVSGSPDVAGGMTISYAGIDLSQTENLYFGMRDDLWPNGFSANGGAITGSELFIFSPPPVGGNTLNYFGLTTIETLNQGPTEMPTWMVMTFSGPFGSTVHDSTTMSYGDVGAMWHVESDFSVTIEMFAQVVEAGDPNFGNWEPARDLYNRLDCPVTGCAGSGSSVDWGFYYEEPAVIPIPAAVWLFSSGLIGLIGCARRKKV